MDFAFILGIAIAFLTVYYLGMGIGRKVGYRKAERDFKMLGKFRNIDEV